MTGAERSHPWLDGAYRPGSGPVLTVRSPSTGKVYERVTTPTADEIGEVARRALASHEDGRWRRLPILERQRVLTRAGAMLREDDRRWARGIAEEMGMPEGAARFIEVPFAAATFEYYGAVAATIRGNTVPVDIPGAPPEYLAYTLPEPIGPVAVITPWNFPLLLPVWKVAAALAAGCPVVLKPAPEAPGTGLGLGALLRDAGLPDGVFSVLPGGDKVGARLVRDPHIAKVAFTGATDSGREVLGAAAVGLKPTHLELGGKSPLVIFSDCDLDHAVNQVLFGGFFNAGQVCQATSRILVERSSYESLTELLRRRAEGLIVGAATDPKTDVGPVVRASHLAYLEDAVAEAVAEGARLVTGGQRLPGPGYFFPPTVLADVTPHMRVAREELFGPVVTVTPFVHETEALRLANATPYALAAGVLTPNIRRALRLARDLCAGTIWVNTVQVLTPTAPFGGLKASGIGKDLGYEGMQEYLTMKTVLVDLNDDPMTYF